MLAFFFAFELHLKNHIEKISKKMRKSKILASKPLPKHLQNPFKIDVPKNMRFVIDFCSNFDACCKSQHQKNVRPRSVLLAFHIIQCFAFCMQFRSKKPTENLSKTTSEPFQNRHRKSVVFLYRFFRVWVSILERLELPSWSQVGHFGLVKFWGSSILTCLS